jgi:hypothetical protein
VILRVLDPAAAAGADDGSAVVSLTFVAVISPAP